MSDSSSTTDSSPGRAWLDHAYRRIADAGLRSGAARSAVIEYLAGEGRCLLAAQELVEAMRERGQSSAASVYRALDELVGLGLVHRVHGPDGLARFEIALLGSHHHHFVDDETGAVTAFEDAALEQAIHAIGARLGVALSSHEVILRGTRLTPG